MVSPFFSSQIFVGTFFQVAFEKERNMSNPIIIPFLIFFKSANVCTFLYKIAPIESCAYFFNLPANKILVCQIPA
jgi:hypothetical protein